MISHSIEVHKHKPYMPPVWHNQPVRPVHQPAFDYGLRMNKLDYATFLQRMYIKKGSWVAKTGKWPIPKGGLFYVCDIQEIHYMAEYEGSHPKAMQVLHESGEKEWVVPGHYYTVLYPPNDVVWEVPT